MGGWRWIFIIEGLLTVVVAVAFKFLVVDWPETAGFLTPSERALLTQRLEADSANAHMDVLDSRAVKRILCDWKVYCAALMYLGAVNTGYATSFFIPTILTEMGYTAAIAQVRTIPIYVVAAASALAVAWCTDRAKHRFGFAISGIVVAVIGYVILLCQAGLTTGVKYMACFFIVTGGYMTQPVVWVWLSNVCSSLAPLLFKHLSVARLWLTRQ